MIAVKKIKNGNLRKYKARIFFKWKKEKYEMYSLQLLFNLCITQKMQLQTIGTKVTNKC